MRIARVILAATLIVGLTAGADAVRPGDSIPGGKKILKGPLKGPPILGLCSKASDGSKSSKPNSAACGRKKAEAASPD